MSNKQSYCITLSPSCEGSGLPDGGLEGQVLTKKSDANQDAEWKDAAAGGDGISYSLEEQWTGKYWIDGKKIYQKTVDCGALPNAITKTVPHGIVNLDNVVEEKALARSRVNKYRIFLPHVNHLSLNRGICIALYDNYISIETLYNWSDCAESYVTLFYTCTDR